jgi:heat shock protein HtpX
MISALRKIENRGELPGATSAVMEMCVDNPREGFADLFATHPSVEARVKALVQYAGGHDPGPLALPSPGATDGEGPAPPESSPSSPWNADRSRPAAGPWTGGEPSGGAGQSVNGRADGPPDLAPGPWGPHGR